ncbi:hypothetical protein XENOCAPTIV_018702 [Xenoophorus captivus]|uniref:Secreted protein n=1 Tax=Xenoophorus captivus TaxID=1517983 RepID=A0ABV0SA12_9TELE
MQLGGLCLLLPGCRVPLEPRRRTPAPGCLLGSLAVVLWLCCLRVQAHGPRHPLRWGWRYSWFASARAGFGSHISPEDDTAQCFSLLFLQLEFHLYGFDKQPVGYHRFIEVEGSIVIRDVIESVSHGCLCATTVDAIPLPRDSAAQRDTRRM